MIQAGTKAGGGGKDRNNEAFLNGRSVLLVEDEFLLALHLEELVESLGAKVRGPFTRLADAMAAARHDDFDMAILDINLNGTMVYPLADDLIGRRVPFLFLSGYGLANLPERFRGIMRLNKPCEPALLTAALKGIAETLP